MNDLSGKVAIVTGAGRRRGIGRTIALGLARAGADVVVSDIETGPEALTPEEREAGWQGLPSVVGEIEALGRKGMSLFTNIADADQVPEMVKQTIDHFGHVDILINNAGITRDRLILRMTPDDFDRVVAVNLRGAFLCTKYVMPHLLKQRGGRIVNISSVVGLSGNPGQANYAAAKAGIVGLTKAVAREVASRNVTVNALAPGFVATGMIEALPEETRKAILGRIPMGRLGTVDDVAGAALFLCSESASYITGQVITIDGGMIA